MQIKLLFIICLFFIPLATVSAQVIITIEDAPLTEVKQIKEVGLLSPLPDYSRHSLYLSQEGVSTRNLSDSKRESVSSNHKCVHGTKKTSSLFIREDNTMVID